MQPTAPRGQTGQAQAGRPALGGREQPVHVAGSRAKPCSRTNSSASTRSKASSALELSELAGRPHAGELERRVGAGAERELGAGRQVAQHEREDVPARGAAEQVDIVEHQDEGRRPPTRPPEAAARARGPAARPGQASLHNADRRGRRRPAPGEIDPGTPRGRHRNHRPAPTPRAARPIEPLRSVVVCRSRPARTAGSRVRRPRRSDCTSARRTTVRTCALGGRSFAGRPPDGASPATRPHTMDVADVLPDGALPAVTCPLPRRLLRA